MLDLGNESHSHNSHMRHLSGLSAVPTTVHHFPPKSLGDDELQQAVGAGGDQGPLLIFIPGNPGVVEFYKEYFQCLSAKLPTLEILGISQAGHDIPSDADELITDSNPFQKVFSLEDQIDHKVQIIENFLNISQDRKTDATDNHAGTTGTTGTSDRDVYIMGHSVGSYMMERIVVRLLDKVNFKFIGFLTPTIIDIHKSEKGIKLSPIVKVIPSFNSLVSSFSNVLGWVPERIKSFLLSQILDNPAEHAFNATNSFTSKPEQIRQSLGLATEEMHVIQDDWEFFNKFLDSTKSIPKWFFFSNVDHWVNNETQKQITERIVDEPKTKVQNSDRIVHSFCVKQSEEFADITIDAMKEFYK